VTTRRGALAAGAVVLLGGCGKDDAAAPPPRASDALLRQLAAERAVVAALAPPAERGVPARVVRARAIERARRLAAALSAAGGRPHDAPQGESAADPDEALRAALAAHAAAVPTLATREHRALVADLVAGAATDLVLLGAGAEAFPGMPA